MHLKTITVEGRIWRYRISGEGGSTVLLLPGALGSGDLIPEYVSKLLPGFRILVPEYSPAHSINEFLNGFDAILAAESVSKTIVYGGSFGGLLAQCWARKYPRLTECLILSGTGIPIPRRAQKNSHMLKVLPLMPMSLVRTFMKFAALMITRKMREQADLWRKEYITLVSNLTREDLATRYKIAIDFDRNYRFSPEDLRSTRILLLEGSADRLAGVKLRKGIRALYPHASIEIVEGAGHSLMLTHPAEWKTAILNFLDR